MRDEREKRDWREMSRTPYTCANPAYLTSPTQLARHTFRASPATPASRAYRTPCGDSSALSLTSAKKIPFTTAPWLIDAVCSTEVPRASSLFLVALPPAPIVLRTLPHVRDPQSIPGQTASQQSYLAKKPGKRETTLASFHQ